MSSGKYLVSKSIALSTIMAQVKHIAKKACNETPKKWATMHTDKALMSSTIG